MPLMAFRDPISEDSVGVDCLRIIEGIETVALEDGSFAR